MNGGRAGSPALFLDLRRALPLRAASASSRDTHTRSASFRTRPSSDWTQILPHREAGVAVGKHDVSRSRSPVLAPLAEGQHDRHQRLALGRERIDDLAAVRRIQNALQDAALDQLGEAVGQDVAGDAEPGLEFLEMMKVVEGAADDQERPLFADQLDGGGQWTLQRLLAKLIDRGCDLALGQSCCTPLDRLEVSTKLCK